jgi:hypothetical protein
MSQRHEGQEKIARVPTPDIPSAAILQLVTALVVKGFGLGTAIAVVIVSVLVLL